MSKSKTKGVTPILKKNLGLTDVEVSVLLPIIQGGNMTAGSIALLSGEPLNKIQRALKGLLNKGYIKVIDGIVPVYRAYSPISSLGDTLSATLSDLGSIAEGTQTILKDRMNNIEKTSEVFLETQQTRIEEINSFSEQYESDILEKISTELENTVGSLTTLFTDYSTTIEEVLNNLDANLDESIGTKLSALQNELDASQKVLDIEMKKITRESNKRLKTESTATTTAIAELQKKSKSLLTSFGKSIRHAFSSTEATLDDVILTLTSRMGDVSLAASNNLSQVLTAVSESIKQQSSQLDETLTELVVSTNESVSGLISFTQESALKHMERTERIITNALEATESFSDDIESWKSEVNTYMSTASQSVIAQLSQVATTDRTFLDVVKNTAIGYLEKTTSDLADGYSSMRTDVRKLGTDTDSFMKDTRTSVIALVEKQVEADALRLDHSNELLHVGLQKWGKKAAKAIDKKINGAVGEISQVLNTETAELNVLAGNITNRLQSAFGSVKSSTAANNETVLLDIKKFVHDYESSIDSKLGSVVSKYTSVTQEQLKQAKTLYSNLSAHLDERLTESVSILTSEFTRVQKEVDGTIDNQLARIDNQANDIRSEFHSHIEEITKQFINLTSATEASFNGLLTSQTLEARDLISSTHTEFKNTLKSEADSLDEDSLKLQQEFGSEIGMKIDNIVESTNALKRTLEEFTKEKRHEVFEAMEQVLANVESSVRSTEDSLADIESGIVKKLGANLFQVSKEFELSVSSVRDNISNQLSSVGEDTDVILAKSSAGVKTVIDTFVSEEVESKQRLVAATSKKVDSLSAKVMKSAGTKMEKMLAQITKSEVKLSESRHQSQDEVVESLESRRIDAGLALDAASVWMESAVSNIESSLETYGNKMNNDIAHIQSGLSKAAKATSKNLKTKTDEQIARLDESIQIYLKASESALRAHGNSITTASSKILERGMDNLSEMPENIVIETGAVLDPIVSVSKQTFSETLSNIETDLSDYGRVSSTVSDEFTNLLKNLVLAMKKSIASTLEQTKQGTLVANQHASRKFSSVGLDLKTSLSKASYDLVEKLRNDLLSKSNQLEGITSKTASDLSESASSLSQTRSNTFGEFRVESDNAVHEWVTGQQATINQLGETVDEVLKNTTVVVQTASDTLNAINSASEHLVALPSKDTWYLSGNAEACAHLVDMAQRAKESIVISILNSDCIDLKKLSKVKNLKRQILIIPEGTKLDPEVPLPKSWRIWKTKSPQFLGVVDDEEMVVGAPEETDTPLFIVSRGKSYLKLYHDILGPELVSSKK
ncbi:MAG: helix-turn-helix domain-containing protein [Candidatus Thorarchaeota archaeon]